MCIRDSLCTAYHTLNSKIRLPLRVTPDIILKAGVIRNDAGQYAALLHDAMNVRVQVLCQLGDGGVAHDRGIQRVDTPGTRFTGMAFLAEEFQLQRVHPRAADAYLSLIHI